MKLDNAILKLYKMFPWPLFFVNTVSWLVNKKYCIGVIGVIFNDRHEILLACHTYRGNKPWGLPGGVAGYHESPAEAIVREIREELGVPVRVSRLIDVIYTEKRIYLEIAYECVIAQANYEFHYNPEVSEARFFPLDQLPLDLMLKEHHRTFTHILELLKTREAETSLESS